MKRLPFFVELRIRLRTQFYYFFRRKKLNELLKERKGECKKCGCCAYGFFGIGCHFFDKQTKECKVFGTKKMPPTCKLFPFDQKNRYEGRIKEIEESCGYYWKTKEAKKKN